MMDNPPPPPPPPPRRRNLEDHEINGEDGRSGRLHKANKDVQTIIEQLSGEYRQAQSWKEKAAVCAKAYGTMQSYQPKPLLFMEYHPTDPEEWQPVEKERLLGSAGKLNSRFRNHTRKPAEDSTATSSSDGNAAAESLNDTPDMQLVDEVTGNLDSLAIGSTSTRGSAKPVSTFIIDFTNKNLPITEEEFEHFLFRLEEISPELMQLLDADTQDKSIAGVSGKIVQIQLDPDDDDKGNANVYIQKFQKGNNRQKKDPLYIEPRKFWELIHTVVVEGQSNLFAQYEVANVSLLVAYDPVRGPQINHGDAEFGFDEFFGTCVLKKGAPQTEFCDMTHAPECPTIDDLEVLFTDLGFGGAHLQSLLLNISNTPEAMRWVKGYGSLFWATPDRIRTLEADPDQYAGSIFKDSHAHRAPPYGEFRPVLFFTLQPTAHADSSFDSGTNEKDELYDGKIQVSRLKLPFLIHEELWEAHKKGDIMFELGQRAILSDIFATIAVESARMNARDDTFEDLPDEFVAVLNNVYEAVAADVTAQNKVEKQREKVAKMKEEIKAKHATIEEEKRKKLAMIEKEFQVKHAMIDEAAYSHL